MATTRGRRLATALLGVSFLGAIVAGAGLYVEVVRPLPSDLSALQEWRPSTACRILDADGEEIDRFYAERRFWVPLDELPDHLIRSVLVAEDRGFYEHRGIEPRGIARAFRANQRAGHTVQGGSTITQQLVKKLLVGEERSWRRKLQEAVLARRLERTLGKDRVLEFYLNFIPFGAGNFGVEAAAMDYFGRSARDIDLGQSALLAGLIPAPSRYSPRSDPRAAAQRRALVLRRRVEVGELTEQSAAFWLQDPVLVPPEGGAGDPGEVADYATEVRRRVRQLFGDDVEGAGLTVHTPLDRRLQAAAREAVREATVALVRRQGPLGPTPSDEDPAAWLGEGRGLGSGGALPDPGCFPSLVTDAAGRKLRAGHHELLLPVAQAARRVVPPGDRSGQRPRLRAVLADGDVLRICHDAGAITLDEAPWADGGAVVLENATGRIRALVGGREAELEGLVRATQALRQPGSTFKPYIWAAELERGSSMLDLLYPAPPPVEGEEPVVPPTLRRALASSSNRAATLLYERQPRGRVQALARALGVSTPLRVDRSVALGSSEVTVLDQALGFAGLARLGVPVEPVFVDAIEVGGERFEAGQTTALGPRLPGGAGPRALPAGVAWEVVEMLSEVVRTGTGRDGFDPKRDRAGKTGTTNDVLDAWFVGFTPRHTVAVWIGADRPTSMGQHESGGSVALPAWKAIAEALDEPQELRFEPPADVIVGPGRQRWEGVRRGSLPREQSGPGDGQPLPGYGRPAPW